jgi:hypothetical protein
VERREGKGLKAEGREGKGLKAEGREGKGLKAEGREGKGLKAEGREGKGLKAEGTKRQARYSANDVGVSQTVTRTTGSPCSAALSKINRAIRSTVGLLSSR